MKTTQDKSTRGAQRTKKSKRFRLKRRIPAFLKWGLVLGVFAALGNISLVLLLAIFPLVLWIVVIADLKQAWRASLIPFSTIRGASQGPVKLKGHLEGETLLSPFTNTPCKAWCVEILYGLKTVRRSPELARSLESRHEFLTLNDGTGLCILPRFNWQLQTEMSWEFAEKATKRLDSLSEINALPEHGRNLIAKEIAKRPGLPQTQTRWIFREYRIDENDTVYAQGVFKSVRGNKTPYDEGNLQRTERKGAAASWFSRWVIRKSGGGLRFDQSKEQDAWRRHARKMLGLEDVRGELTLPFFQTFHTLVESTVDIVEGNPTQYYFPFFATNNDPIKQRRRDNIKRLIGIALAIFLTGLVIHLYDPTLLPQILDFESGQTRTSS